MRRVDELLKWLAGRRGTCSLCGSALVTIVGNGLQAQTCPTCDATPGARPRRIPHARLHYTEIPGCPECTEARRARA